MRVEDGLEKLKNILNLVKSRDNIRKEIWCMGGYIWLSAMINSGSYLLIKR